MKNEKKNKSKTIITIAIIVLFILLIMMICFGVSSCKKKDGKPFMLTISSKYDESTESGSRASFNKEWQLDKIETYMIENNVETIYSKYTYKYDDNNNLTEKQTYIWDEGESEWFTEDSFVSNYVLENGKVKSYTTPDGDVSLTYDNGKLKSEVIYSGNNYYDKFEYTYNANGNLIKVEKFCSYGTVTPSYESIYSLTFSYENNKPASMHYQKDTNNADFIITLSEKNVKIPPQALKEIGVISVNDGMG